MPNQFVFKVDETTPKQVVEALQDFGVWLELFETRSREYGQGSFFFLGSKGQFSDIYRKIIKLKTALWDDKPEQLTSEGVVEVINDLIGHLFLTLQCLRKEGLAQGILPRGSVKASDLVDGAIHANLDQTRVAFSKISADKTLADTLSVDPREQLGAVLSKSDAFARLSAEDSVGNHAKRMDCKRKKVRELYPQIGEGSLMARNEESLDWLIESARTHVGSGLPDLRTYKFDKGDKVLSVGGSDRDWLHGATGTVTEQDRQSAGLWYKVIFDNQSGETTIHEDKLERVPSSEVR